ncbi:hypothetical protein [Streptomyces sp. NBC_01465]|uniref:hypothetical protein n=1 Tax=Streptomyces sp. NBC_01465 TaxID=2903878 RepID=UPI002E303B8C|nr:hypothetical protein [Streptomyces sp. NBC_01465]
MNRTPQSEADRLLSALDPLPYPRRMRELVAHVREMASNEVRPLVTELYGRGPYERHLAAVAAAAGRDAAWIAEHLADPDPVVRGQALRVAGSLGVPDEAFEAALDDAPEETRRQILAVVVGGRRTALADRLVERVRADWGDAEAGRLLAGCSEDVVVRLLPGLFHSVQGWTALGKRHPGVLLDVAGQELAALPEAMRGSWWARYARAVGAAVRAEPARVLDLVERFGPEVLPYQLHDRLGEFAAVDPGRVLRLLLGNGGHALRRSSALTRSVRVRLMRSGAGEVAAYGRQAADSGDLAPLLLALPPSERLAFYRAAVADRGAGAAAVDEDLLAALPRSGVAEEARRMADSAREQGAQWHTVLFAESFLPVADVRDRLVAATRRPAADDRALAWPLLVRNAARAGDPAAVTSVLEEMARLRNEQDPVRSAALHALAATRGALFTADAEPHLDRIAVDAVEARDSSSATRRNLSDLALSVLREHAAGGQRELVNWALRTLVRISGNTGGADLGQLDLTLRRGQEHQVFEALRPWIEAGAEKADFSLVLALARAVGRRAEAMAELQELLWQAVRYGSAATVRSALDLWLEPRPTRDERVARVLAQEPSAAVLPSVYGILAVSRTDLLDTVLGETPPYGRFLTKGTTWTAPVGRYVRVWTPRQQQAAARQLAKSASDAGLPLYTRTAAITQGALLPGTGAEFVRRWTGSSEVVLAEAALAALARTDRPDEALPELLTHTGTDRARVAVYAATSVSRRVAPSRLAGLLRDVLLSPTAKVTSRKEAARLAAARLPVVQAAELITEAYGQPDTHRDVRAACVAFAGGLLVDDRVWAMLRDAAGGLPVLRTAVLRVLPLELAAPYRERYARLVRDVCDTDDEETAAVAYTALARWAPWSPDAPEVLAAAAADLDRRRTWRFAVEGLVVAAAASAEGGRGVAQALGALAAAGDVPDAEERRDRPARQRITHLVMRLNASAYADAEAVRPAALAASELLAGHEEYAAQSAELLVAHLDLGAGAQELQASLDRLAAVTEGRPALAARTAASLAGRCDAGDNKGGDLAVLETVARTLAGHGGPAQGLFASAIVEAGGSRTDWAAPWREQLRALRRHPVADVRDAALAEVTAYEGAY